MKADLNQKLIDLIDMLKLSESPIPQEILDKVNSGVALARELGIATFGDFSLAGSEVELHHAILHDHAGHIFLNHDRHIGGVGCRSCHFCLGSMSNAALVDDGADDGGDNQSDQGKQKTQGKALLAIVVRAVEGHG